MLSDIGSWLRTPRPVERPRLRLVCFPYAGGSATVFHAWSALFPPDIEVRAVQLPARQDRLREPALPRVEAIVSEVARALDALPPAPLALYGHSFGALLAYEFARLRRPLHLVVAARKPPHFAVEQGLAELPARELLERMHQLYGAPVALLRDPALADLVVPALRADFRATEAYRWAPSAPLDLPLTVLGGSGDASVPASHLASWGEVSARPVAVHTVEAGHLFVDTHRAWVVERVLASLGA